MQRKIVFNEIGEEMCYKNAVYMTPSREVFKTRSRNVCNKFLWETSQTKSVATNHFS